MGCVAIIVALLAPRLVLFFIWLLTPWFTQAFASWIAPLLGFLFMPYTTLAYMGATLGGGITTLWLVLIVLAVLVDLSHLGFGRRYAYARRRGRSQG